MLFLHEQHLLAVCGYKAPFGFNNDLLAAAVRYVKVGGISRLPLRHGVSQLVFLVFKQNAFIKKISGQTFFKT